MAPEMLPFEEAKFCLLFNTVLEHKLLIPLQMKLLRKKHFHKMYEGPFLETETSSKFWF